MGHCDGTLVMHSDGTMAVCSEELAGRCCAGPTADHQGGWADCTTWLGPGGCELCAVDDWDGDTWRHVVHVGRLATMGRRCRAHSTARRAVHELARPMRGAMLESATRR